MELNKLVKTLQEMRNIYGNIDIKIREDAHDELMAEPTISISILAYGAYKSNPVGVIQSEEMFNTVEKENNEK